MKSIRRSASSAIGWLRQMDGLAVFALAALALFLVVLADSPPEAGAALPTGSMITVGNISDTNTASDDSLSLREAILLATDTGGTLGHALSHGECNAITDGSWDGSNCVCMQGGCHHGAGFSDHIIFDPGLVAPGPSISLSGVLPELSTGSDSISGGEKVIISPKNGSYNAFNCLNITSDGNELDGLGFQLCQTAISVRLGQDNHIGGPFAQGAIVIQESSYAGVELYHGDHNTVQRVSIWGNGAASSRRGILIESSNNLIGAVDPGNRNHIAGNEIGIQIAGNTGNAASGNTVIGNCIGLAPDCNSQASKDEDEGIEILQASGNLIGGSDSPGQANYISWNGLGVVVAGATSHGNSVQGNFIGTDGTSARPNSDGVRITNGATNNIIGGTTSGARNVISGNGEAGVLITGAGTGNVVEGNYIGVDSTGTGSLGNGDGVVVRDSNSSIVGGTTAGARNLISGNTVTGVRVTGTSTLNVIEGNYVGVNRSGDGAIPNREFGIEIDAGAHQNKIGGTEKTSPGGPCTGACNVISGSTLSDGFGVFIAGGSNGNQIEGNYIGTNSSGNAAVANTVGVTIVSASETSVGNGTAGRNVISGNGTGILVGFDSVNLDPSGTIISGNYIGVGVNGTGPLGNALAGIEVIRGNDTAVGGVTPDSANIIAYNGGSGVHLESGIDNKVTGNSIFSNAERGISLQINSNDPTKPNDDKDPDTGSNNYQNFPVLTSAQTAAGATEVIGTLNTKPSVSVTIEVFSNPACDSVGGSGEGKTFLARTAAVTTDAGGNLSFDLTGLPAVAVGQVVTATATTADGTSEFSACLAVTAGAPASGSATVTATPGPGSLVWGDTLCNNIVGGDDALDVLLFATNLSQLSHDVSCPDAGFLLQLPGFSLHKWGDFDCDGQISAADGLEVIKMIAGLPLQPHSDCPVVGDSLKYSR